ncbi:hypothetical protein ACFL9S_12440 [Erwinia sp. AnSW2-5]|uniref:hypothetical protein n=1 Tax=Erwinia sp. AnSW2-5 TaxID=3367692 RepID=UPI00385B8215
MRKSFKIFSGIIIVVAIALTCAWPWIKMDFAGNAHYTGQDKREYDFYTPDILKNMPRISPRYSFDYTNITGPATHVHAMKFYDTDTTREVENYLASLGYRQVKCDVDAVCWRSTDPEEAIDVDILKGEKTVIVQVVYHFT